jgi:hypothetical protein
VAFKFRATLVLAWRLDLGFIGSVCLTNSGSGFPLAFRSNLGSGFVSLPLRLGSGFRVGLNVFRIQVRLCLSLQAE